MCSKCSSVYNKTSNKCPKCLFDSLNYEVNYDPYQGTSSQHPPEKPKIHVWKPCMATPCSQESVYNVMKHIQNICSVGANENCKWTILISDGVSYSLASDIQDFVLFCQEHDTEINKKGI